MAETLPAGSQLSESPPAPSPLSTFAGDGLGLVPPAAPSSLLRGRADAATREQAALEDLRGKAVEGRAGLETRAARDRQERAALTPPDVALPPAPATAARPFLHPPESLLGQLQTVLLGIGALATQIGGLRGSAIGATAAFKGMVEGWQAGDHERVTRAYDQWKATSDRLLAQHTLAMDKLRTKIEDQKLTAEEMWNGLQLDLKASEWRHAAAAADKHDYDALLKEYETAHDRGQRLSLQNRKLDQGFGQLLERQREFDVREKERAQEFGLRMKEMELARLQRAADAEANRDLKRELGAQAAATRLEMAEIRQAVSPLNKPVGKDAAHMANAKGQHPSELDTMEQAVSKGFHFFQGKTPPEVSSRVTLAAIDQALGLLPALKDKGLLMNRPGAGQALLTWVRRDVTQRGDDDLTTFLSHTSTLVRVARELGDIGFRTKAAIEGTLNLVERAQTASGVEKALRQLRNLVEMSAPSTVTRKFRAFDTRANKVAHITLDPGETVEDVLREHPEMDLNR